MVFDSLTHVTADGRWFHTTLDASERELQRQLDASETKRAMVVALAGHIENQFVLDACGRDPARLIPCASINPADYAGPADAKTALRAELRDSAYKAVKLHPRLGRYDPLDPRCLAIFEELASWAQPLPVWLDTLFYFRGGTLQKPPVDAIHQIVGSFPTVVFVLLHGGGSWILQVAEAIRDCPNAFLDISFTLQRYRSSSIAADLRYLLESFDQRMVFGSDFPEISISKAVENFREAAAGLPADKCANVLGGNLTRILDLETL